MPTYHGQCHCGALQLDLTCQPITAGKRCNCSVCIRRGVVMSDVYFPPEAFARIDGRAALSRYVWGDRDMTSYFCATCGVFVFAEAVAKPGHLRINLGCLDGIDPLSLAIDVIDGRSF